MHSIHADRMTNSVDPDQNAVSGESDLSPYCLL